MSISKKKTKKIGAEEFDKKFDRGEDIVDYLDVENAVVVKRVNVDLPLWMIELLDKEALNLNISRQAVIKFLINAHLNEIKKQGKNF